MPPEQREAGAEGSTGPIPGQGFAAGMVEFARPLVDAAGSDHAALDNALQLGMIFYNIGVAAEIGEDKLVGEQLSEIERATGGDTAQFRDIAVMMLGRFAAMRPGARPHLLRILQGLWGRDLGAEHGPG